MADQVIKAGEIDDISDFGEVSAPPGFDPNAEGYQPPPPGWHNVMIGTSENDDDAFGIMQNNNFRYKDDDGSTRDWLGNQFRPKIVVASGPFKGRSVTDFLPMPTKGAGPMPTKLANRWANVLRGFGFKCPPNQIVPAGFKLKSLAGARGMACIEIREWEDDDTGKTKSAPQVKYMGYKPSGSETPVGEEVQKKPAAASRPAVASAKEKAQETAQSFSDL